MTQISEVRGLESDVITMQDIFAFDARGAGDRVRAELKPTGIRPAFTDQLLGRGIELPAAWFGYLEHTKEVRP